MQHRNREGRKPSRFEIYLRTGRRVQGSDIELKFNPWHDPEDGRFTFAGAGKYFGGGSALMSSPPPASPREPFKGGGGKSGRGGASGEWGERPTDAMNYSIYKAKTGDSLTRIAAMRKGLRVNDLAAFNNIPIDQPIKVGQSIRIPNQSYLDDSRRAHKTLLELAYYVNTHGGKLPPNVSHPPSIEEQISTDFRIITANQYGFVVDAIGRPHSITGAIRINPSRGRSQSIQKRAGGKDRLPSDHGGHYIARRFDGPIADFNHFAQDANFNLSAYAKLERIWETESRANKNVWIKILPKYKGLSLRPYRISIKYVVDGHNFYANFDNLPSESKK